MNRAPSVLCARAFLGLIGKIKNCVCWRLTSKCLRKIMCRGVCWQDFIFNQNLRIISEPWSMVELTQNLKYLKYLLLKKIMTDQWDWIFIELNKFARAIFSVAPTKINIDCELDFF